MEKRDAIIGTILILMITSAFCNLRAITASPESWARMVSSNGWETASLIGLWHFDEGTGTEAHDSSSYGNHGTVNGAMWVDGVTGKALSFDGADDYINVTKVELLRIFADLTIEASIKPNDVSGLNLIVGQGEVDTTEENNWLYGVLIRDGRVGYYHEYGNVQSVWVLTDSPVVSVGELYKITVTRDATLKEIQIYVNETLVKSGSYTENPTGGSSTSLYIGGMDSAYSFDGIIDEVHIWDEVRVYGHQVGFWRFDEGSGTTARDSSGYKNDGEISGAVWVDGEFGKALNFDGVNDYVAVPDSPSLNITEAITIEAWVKRNSWKEAGGISRKKEAYGIQNAWSGSPNYAEGKFEFQLVAGGVDTHLCSNMIGSNGVWYHLAGVYDGSKMRIYINGELDIEQSISGAISSSDYPLLMGHDGYGNMFNGTIDDMQVWNEARTAEQIQKDAMPEPLVGFWRFDEGSGTTAHDSSEYHNDGMVSGAIWVFGRYCKALDFDGVDDYAEAPDSLSLDFSGAFSLEFWVKFDSVDTEQWLVSKGGDWMRKGFFSTIGNSLGTLRFGMGNGTAEVFADNGGFITGVWYHVVMTYDGLTMRVYSNGELLPNTATNTYSYVNDYTVRIGSSDGLDPLAFNGTIDEVKIWSEALPPPPPSPLVGFWRFDEGAGTTAYDSSEYGNNGTLLPQTRGAFGGALGFDGVNDYVKVPDSGSLDISSKITIEAWIYPYTVAKDYQYIVSKYNHTISQRGYALFLNKDKVQFALSPDGTAYTILASATSIAANVWTHVAATSDGTTMKLFINGVQDPNTLSAPATIHTHNCPLIIGAYLPDVVGLERQFNGTIDEVRVSNVSRTSFDLTVAPSVDANTIALWHFNEETGGIAYDETENNNDGTITGATWLLAGSTWTPNGKYNAALTFDGVNDYVEVPDSDSLDIISKITLEAWIYPYTVDKDYQYILSKYNHTASQRGYALLLVKDKVQFVLSPDGTAYTALTSASSIVANAWTHVAATSDGTTMKLFINEEQDPNTQVAPASIHTHDYPLIIGAYLPDITGFERQFNGTIDEVAVFNEVRSVHDVAISSVTTWKTVVGEGMNCSVQLYVVVENHGEYSETFNVSLYSDSSLIGNQTVSSLESKNFAILTFTWNTTGFAKGKCTISAVAETVQGETDTVDNTCIDGIVTVTITGDVDGDFDVDILDVVKITAIYASKIGDPQFRPNSDIDGDGVITILDVVKCTSHYAQKDP